MPERDQNVKTGGNFYNQEKIKMMKTICKLLLFQILLVMFIVGPCIAFNPYVFKELDPKATHQERLKSCQIPNEILKAMPTEDLIETCLNYPFIINIYAYNSFDQGLRAVIKEFNGFQELFKREDAGSLLLEKYIAIDPLKFQFPTKRKLSDNELLDAFKPLDNIKTIEIIFNHDDMFSKLMNAEKKRLGQETINKIDQLRRCPIEFVNQATLDTTTQIMARFISLIEERSEKISAPRTINIDKAENVERLISIVQKYISQKQK